MSHKENKPKLTQYIGIKYEVVMKGEDLHDTMSFFGTLTEITHIGVPLVIFDNGGYIVNANRIHYMERIG